MLFGNSLKALYNPSSQIMLQPPSFADNMTARVKILWELSFLKFILCQLALQR